MTDADSILIFGGVYSNLQALESLRKRADAQGFAPERIYCSGDIAGYCADPRAVLDAVRDWGVHCIAGNVELQLVDGADDCGCNFVEGGRCDTLSRRWFPYVQSQVGAAQLDWLRSLPQHLYINFGGRRLCLVHGSFGNTSQFVFKSTLWDVKQAEMRRAGVDFIIGGHSGLPFVDCQGDAVWLNAGVIGMPANDGTPRTWFATLESVNNGAIRARLHALEYDHQTAARRMRECGLPLEYAQTLLDGLWDNCEILPAAETAQRGQNINETAVELPG